jgi:hypothetical protein
MAVVTMVGDGSDSFLEGHVVRWKENLRHSPNIYAMVPKRVVKRRRTSDALQNMCRTTGFRGALTVVVILEFVELYQQLDEMTLQQGVSDTHIWKLLASGQCSSNSAYRALFHGVVYFDLVDRLWKTWAPVKCKFFM